MLIESPNRVWQRALSTLAALAMFVVLVAALYWARSVLIPIALAVLVMFVLSPLVILVRRTGIGRVPAILLTVLIAVLFCAGVAAAVGWQLVELTNELPNRSEQIKDKLASAKLELTGTGDSRFGKMIEELTPIFSPPPQPDPNLQRVVVETPDSFGAWAKRVPEVLSPASEVLGQLLFALVLSVFMLFKKDDLRNRLIRLVGDTRLTTATKAVDDASRRISRYLLMQLLINTVFGVIITIAMFVIRVPYAPLWGVVASFMRYIPYLGTWLGLIPPVIVTLAFMDGWWPLISVIGIYAGLELFCNNFVEPRAYGASMGLSEVAQLIAAAFWAFLWGPIGLILSGPLTVCLLVLGKYVPRLQFLDTLLGDEQVLTADVRFYQRLAAGDQDGASEIVEEALKEKDAAEVFDEIIIPAMCYAKRDVDRLDLSGDELAKILNIAREIVAEVSEKEAERATAIPGGAKNSRGERIRVLAVPARDNADEVGVEMLKATLDPQLWEVEVPTVAQLTSEIVARAVEFNPAVIVIGSLPPEGLAHTRLICKRIARQFADAQIVIGRWNATMDTPEQRKQLAAPEGVFVATSLAQTSHHLQTWLAALETRQQPAEKSDQNRKIGTATAIPTPA